jgi:membrane protease YdiL (CAAX protease family)
MGAWGLRPSWGRIPKAIWVGLALGTLALPSLLLLPPLSVFPSAVARQLLSHLPGGLLAFGLYSLVVNVALEELFWRGAVLQRHDWPAWRHGLAFGLHHGVLGALRFGWAWAPLGLLIPAAAGALWSASARRQGGLGVAYLTHLWADAALICLAASQLH